MRDCKSGAWYDTEKQRMLANNSAAYTERPDMNVFFEEWHSLYKSKSGERGIFNRVAAKKKVAENGRRELDHEFGTNPCGEIILRPQGLCNLSEVVVRAQDDLASLTKKVELATILGTFQSTLTNYRYVRQTWKRNAEDERLLGVSMTGILDNAQLAKVDKTSARWLNELRDHAVETNRVWAEKLDIRPAAAITTVKPSGTVSQLVDSASGIHPRFAGHYVRTVRADKKDPLAVFMRAKDFPVEDCVMKPESVDVFSFPVRAPAEAIDRNAFKAIEQLNHYLMFAKHWCEHNPSITVYVKEHEWMAVGDWVYSHFDEVGGVSFLPHTEHVYRQAPYTECTRAQYEELAARMPIVDWAELSTVEKEDHTDNVKDLACSGGHCELP
jgi:ribonucleoside-diphosphate reductase alpha chain